MLVTAGTAITSLKSQPGTDIFSIRTPSFRVHHYLRFFPVPGRMAR